MALTPGRLGIVFHGGALCGVLLRRGRAEAFVVESEEPAVALRARLDALGHAPRSVAIGLARDAVTVKPIDLPPVGGETRDMVRFELERHLAFSAEDAPFDFAPLPREREQGGAEAKRVLVVAADRRVVEAALKLAEEAKLRPLSLTVAAHELTALVRPVGGRRVAWVHRSGERADLLLLHGATLVLSRAIPADEEGIVSEIRRSFTIARWRDCDAVWVSGTPAPSLTPALGALGASVTRPPYTPRARRSLGALGQGPQGALELALAVASRRGARPLDLIPAHMKPRRLTRHQWVTLGMTAATVVLAVIALLAPGIREQRRLDALTAEIRRLDPEVRVVERVLAELERKRQLLATVATVEKAGLRPLPALRELTETLPGDAWLTMLAFDSKGVELTGQAAQASALISLLENSALLERVEFASPVTRGREREQFRIRAAWETLALPATSPRRDGDGPDAAGAPRPAARPPGQTPEGRSP